jgi:hypothetical protein
MPLPEVRERHGQGKAERTRLWPSSEANQVVHDHREAPREMIDAIR